MRSRCPLAVCLAAILCVVVAAPPALAQAAAAPEAAPAPKTEPAAPNPAAPKVEIAAPRTAPASAPVPVPAAVKPDDTVIINLSGVTLHLVVQYISQFTGKTIILPDRFPGDRKVDILSAGQTTVPARKAMEILATVLRNAGYVMIESPYQIQIVPEGTVEGVPMVATTPEGAFSGQTLVTITKEVRNADATKLAPVLDALRSKTGRIQVYADSNTLIITEYGPQLRTMLALIDKLDMKWATNRPEVMKLEKTSVDSLRAVIEAYVKNMGQNAEPLVQKRLASFAIISQPPINSFVLFGHPDDIARVRDFIRLVDVAPADSSRTFHTYPVLNRDVTEMVGVLNSVFAAVKARGGSASVEPAPTVIADAANSTVIIISAPDRYREFLPLLQQLDKAKAQVLIESALIEMSVDKLADLGVELSTTDAPKEGSGPRGVVGSTFDLTTLTAAGTRIPVLPAGGGVTAAIFKGLNIGAIVRLSQTDDNVAFIAAPQLMASDNKPAVVEIAEEREIQKSITTPEGRTSEVTGGTFIKAAITLEITPHVNEEGTVRLEIKQVTEQFLPSTTSTSGTPLNNKTSRMAKTEVNVPDGSMVVIAGLTRTVQAKTIRKVPVLGNIPLLGFFFRRTETTNQQRNLCVFITPHIYRTKDTLAETAEQRKAELRAVNEQNPELKSDNIQKFTTPNAPTPGKTP